MAVWESRGIVWALVQSTRLQQSARVRRGVSCRSAEVEMPPGSKAIALLILLIPCLAKQGIEERRLKAREKLLKISLRKVKIDAIKRKLMDQVTFPKKKARRVKLLKKRTEKKRKPKFRKKGKF